MPEIFAATLFLHNKHFSIMLQYAKVDKHDNKMYSL